MRNAIRSQGWILVCDAIGFALLAVLLLGGTGTSVFAALMALAPLLFLAGMALDRQGKD